MQKVMVLVFLWLQYIATPHALLCLIGLDLDITLDKALKVLEDSGEIGLTLHSEDY